MSKPDTNVRCWDDKSGSYRYVEKQADDAAVMRLWRECGLPEYFLGNGGSNHKLVAFARRCAELTL